MSKRATKMFFGIVGLGLIAFLIVMYTSFNGNPLRVYLTKAQIAAYLRDKYPSVAFSDITSHYNFKSGTYDGWAVAQLDSTELRLRIDQYRRGQFSDNLVEAKLTAQAKSELLPVGQTLIPALEDAHFWVSWDKDKVEYKLDTNFSKTLPVEIGMDVRWSGSAISKEQFLNEVLTFHQGMKQQGYNISSYFFCYKYEENTFALSYHREEQQLARDLLLERVSHWVDPKGQTVAPTPRIP